MALSWLKRTACLCSLLMGCEAETTARTELLLVVDSDLSVPSELDRLTIHATGPGARDESATAVLGDGEPPLPRRLGLVHESGPLGPIFVEVEGHSQDQLVLKRSARVSFVEGRTLVLAMHLVRSCLTQQCSSDETCGEQGCRAVDLSSAELPAWNGQLPRLDASSDELDAGTEAGAPVDSSLPRDGAADASQPDGSTRDAGMCVPRTEQCNSMDDDCDGVVDDGFDLMTNPDHCGRCNVQCQFRCCAGACRRSC